MKKNVSGLFIRIFCSVFLSVELLSLLCNKDKSNSIVKERLNNLRKKSLSKIFSLNVYVLSPCKLCYTNDNNEYFWIFPTVNKRDNYKEILLVNPLCTIKYRLWLKK